MANEVERAFLLDTCTFVWFLTNSYDLSSEARVAIMNPASQVYLSVVSAWEIGRKWSKGDLTLPGHPATVIPAARRAAGISALELTEEDTLMAEKLPLLHKDPFDRLIVAQALVEGWPVVSHDPVVAQYPVTVIW